MGIDLIILTSGGMSFIEHGGRSLESDKGENGSFKEGIMINSLGISIMDINKELEVKIA